MHINYKRGETRAFVWHRESRWITHDTWVKRKRRSHAYCKKLVNRKTRRERGIPRIVRLVRRLMS